MIRKLLIALFILGLFSACNDSSKNDGVKNRKEVLDSLTIQKENKSDEIKRLKFELDSLKRLRDSLGIK